LYVYLLGKLYEDAQSTSGDDHHVYERHRHRYEVNPSYVEIFETKGLHFVGCDETGKRMEIMELEGK
jgi:CTP synthase